MWTTVGEISQSILYGVSESAKSHGAYKLLRITDIQNNFVNWKTVPFTDYDESKAEFYLLKDGDILFARTGATVGKSYLVTNLQENAIYASYLIRVQTYNQVLPEFVKYFFESGYYWSQILCNSVGIGQPNVNGTILANLMLPIPPIKEQKRIVKELTKWLRIIDKIDRGKESLQDSIKHAKSKILDLAIHGKLVPQNPNDEPAVEQLKRINPKAEIITDNGHYQKLPVGWTICRLKDISKIVTGSTPSKSNKGYYGGIFPFFKPADLDAGRHVYKATEYLSEDGKKVSRVVPMGATAICCIGTIGKVGYLMYEGATNQQINCAIPSKVVDSVFLFYLCASPLFSDKLNSESSAVTISIVNKSKIEAIFVPLPPLAEQKRIVSKIEEIFAQLETIETAL